MPMESRKNTILAAVAGLCLWAGSGCSSAPIKMECQEVQARIDYGNLTGDQLRFAQQELEDCRGRVNSAEAKDSAFVDGTEKRFTPTDADPVPAADTGAAPARKP